MRLFGFKCNVKNIFSCVLGGQTELQSETSGLGQIVVSLDKTDKQ